MIVGPDGTFVQSTDVAGIWPCNNNNQFACFPNQCDNSSLWFNVPSGKIRGNIALSSALLTADSTATSLAPTSQQTNVASTARSDCPSHIGIYAGLGAGLGILLLLALGALLLTCLQLQKHKKRRNVGVVDNAPMMEGGPQHTTVAHDLNGRPMVELGADGHNLPANTGTAARWKQ